MRNAYFVATTELVGGSLLILGLIGRLVPVPLIPSDIQEWFQSWASLGFLLPAPTVRVTAKNGHRRMTNDASPPSGGVK